MTNNQMINDQSQSAIRIQRFLVYNLLLIAILVVGAYLRFTGMDWDERQWIHPDEGHMRIITSAIRTPDSLSLYFDTHNSPLNCRNNGQQYSYGTLPLFLTRMTAEWLDSSCGKDSQRVEGKLSTTVANLLLASPGTLCHPGTFTGSGSALVGRMLSCLADLGTILLVCLIARRLYGGDVGLLAAALYALTAFSIQQTHFFTVESATCFFTTLTVYFSVRAGQSGSWFNFGMAGLATGFAAACKISGAFVSPCVALAAMWWWLHSKKSRAPKPSSFSPFLAVIIPLIIAGLLALVAFRIGQPYAFEGPGFFDVKPSPEWFGRLSQIRLEQSGEIDMPSGRQWTDRSPILFPWINMVVWGMGLPLGLAAWAGWALVGYELFRGKKGKYAHLILWVWVTLMFLYQGSGWVKSMRYLLSLYPLLVIMASYLLVRLCRASAKHVRYVGLGTASIVVIGTVLWTSAFFSIYLRTNTRVAASRWIFDNVPTGVTVANEHWDWGVPLRVDGHDPFGGMYSGIEMQHYHEDTPEKRAQLYDWLNRADYIFTASNRLYASIPRLPLRYPLTIEYYRALFAGELGFKLAADFTSRPAIGPFQFPDQENPFPLMETGYVHQTNPIKVNLPPAEEAFSVYDHPRVLIFCKTDAYSRELVESVLGKIDLTQVIQGFSPRQTVASMSPSLDIEKAVPNVNLGTSRGKLIPIGPALLVWWFLITALGWLALPLAAGVFKNFPDGGWALSRAMGLLLFSWLAFVLVSKTSLPFYQSSLWGLLAGLAAVSAVVTFINRKAAALWLKPRLRTMLWTEAVFAGAFLFFALIKFFNPHIHDIMGPGYFGGGEPLGITYLSAVTRCSDFPVFDPWLAGASSSYYYFGYVIAGVMTKLSGAEPAVTYNLSLAMFFSLTVLTAWGLGLALTGKKRFALVAGIAVTAFGSMWTAPYISQWIADHVNNLWQIPLEFFGAMFSRSFIWDPTRFPGLVSGAIYEFPFFSYLYSDLHPHNMVLPFSMVLLSLFLAPFLSAKKGLAAFGESKLNLGLWIFLTALFLDSQYAINTWSWPVFLWVGLVCMPLAGWAGRQGDWKDRFIAGCWGLLLFVTVFALGYLILMQPFREHFFQAGGDRLHLLSLADRKMPFYQTIAFYFFGLMGLAALTGLRLKSWWTSPDQSSDGRKLSVRGWKCLLEIILDRDQGRIWAIALWVAVIMLFMAMAATGVWRGQVLWFAAACAVVCAGCFSMQRAMDGREAFVWALAFATFAMVTGSEIWYVNDRTNTVFKFWFNGWIFFGLIFAYGFWRAELAGRIVEEQTSMSISAQSRETEKKALTGFPWRCFVVPAVGVPAFVSLFVFAELDQTLGNSDNFAFSAAWLGVLLLLSMAAAFVPTNWARPAWRGLFTALLIFGMLYPLGATWARISITSRFYDHYRGNTGLIDAVKQSPGLTGPTLDGLEFLRAAKPRRLDKMSRDYDKHDAVIIDWLNKNADLTEVVLEAPGVEIYKGLTRISIYTGLPTLLGWKYQVGQQLGNRAGNQLSVRQRAADRIYRSRSAKTARRLLDQYKVRWIVVGGIEQRVYAEKGLTKFADFCEAVTTSGDSVLYRYPGG